MKVARIRLAIAALLLFGWLGWLGYLAATKTNPVIVSRSQAMSSTHFVVAELTVDPETGQPSRQVQVLRELRPEQKPLDGRMIDVWNIREARIAGNVKVFQEKTKYLLMLTKSADGRFDLTPPPRAPGNDGPMRPGPWAYRWDDPGVKEQFEKLVP